uniref:Uncharacterized protein n=1 Tax=Arundo donax TaxID=35708 RepID=A0A0A9N5F6_ARUDO
MPPPLALDLHVTLPPAGNEDTRLRAFCPVATTTARGRAPCAWRRRRPPDVRSPPSAGTRCLHLTTRPLEKTIRQPRPPATSFSPHAASLDSNTKGSRGWSVVTINGRQITLCSEFLWSICCARVLAPHEFEIRVVNCDVLPSVHEFLSACCGMEVGKERRNGTRTR